MVDKATRRESASLAALASPTAKGAGFSVASVDQEVVRPVPNTNPSLP